MWENPNGGAVGHGYNHGYNHGKLKGRWEVFRPFLALMSATAPRPDLRIQKLMEISLKVA